MLVWKKEDLQCVAEIVLSLEGTLPNISISSFLRVTSLLTTRHIARNLIQLAPNVYWLLNLLHVLGRRILQVGDGALPLQVM